MFFGMVNQSNTVTTTPRKLGGGNSNIFLMFTPNLGVSWFPFWRLHMFQTGGKFNHRPFEKPSGLLEVLEGPPVWLEVGKDWMDLIWSNYSNLTRVFTWNGGLVKEIPLIQGNLGWWNIIIWPDWMYLISCGQGEDVTPPKKLTAASPENGGIPWKRGFLLETIIFGFDVNFFGGCIYFTRF